MPFVKGDTNINRSGRPKGATSTLPLLRDKLFALALRRMKKDPELQDVDNTTLIKFISSNLPKDMSLNVTRPPDITYISNVPRPELQNSDLQQKVESSNAVSVCQSIQAIDSTIDSNI